MKTLTITIIDPSGNVVAWVKASSSHRYEDVTAEVGGPMAASFPLPSKLAWVEGWGAIAGAAAYKAGFHHTFEWQGQWPFEEPLYRIDDPNAPHNQPTPKNDETN